ncbi:MAG: hypothetical protein LBU32_28725 [Clostridiales bacterium]|nr:hypothetical protein [Clostridiales bacterium]
MPWIDEYFNIVETAVYSRYVFWEESDGREYFRPDHGSAQHSVEFAFPNILLKTRQSTTIRRLLQVVHH